MNEKDTNAARTKHQPEQNPWSLAAIDMNLSDTRRDQTI